MEGFYEEIDALRAILMNDVDVDITVGGEVRVIMKLEGCTVAVQLQGKIYYNVRSIVIQLGSL